MRTDREVVEKLGQACFDMANAIKRLTTGNLAHEAVSIACNLKEWAQVANAQVTASVQANTDIIEASREVVRIYDLEDNRTELHLAIRKLDRLVG